MDAAALKAAIESPVFYGRFFPDLTKKVQKCPFHDDGTASMSLDIEKGLWNCFACGEGGDIVQFWMKSKGVDFKAACNEIALEFGITKKPEQPRKETIVDLEIDRRMKQIDDVRPLLHSRGILDNIIVARKLGWCRKDERLWIPVYESGACIGLRRYDLKHLHAAKFLGDKGSKVTLYPQDVVKQNGDVWLMGGEPDTLTALSLGFPAATFTGGEGSYSNEHLPLLRGKAVYICYDVDDAGRRGSLRVAEAVAAFARRTYIVSIPPDGLPDNGDFTDFCRLHEFKDIKSKLLVCAKAFDPGVTGVAFERVPLHRASSSDYVETYVETSAVVAGSGVSPFFAPKRLVATCQMDMGKMCASCPIEGRKEVNLDEREILALVDIGDDRKKKELRKLCHVPAKCVKNDIREETTAEVNFVNLIPDADIYSEDDYKFGSVDAYFIGPPLEDNSLYHLVGKPVADPKTQGTVFISSRGTMSEKAYSNYTVNDSVIAEIERVRPGKTFEEIDAYIAHRTADIMTNVCGLRERRDLIQAYDLTWHSVLSFQFQGRVVHKGWLEALVLGDTRTGKSAAAESMIRFFKCGKYVNCEGATMPGIIGGQNALGSKVVFTWGVVPMQDGRLVVLDETQDLSVELIGSLSAIRSRGVASRPIVGGERMAKSRVRLIWIANSRSNRTIKQHSSGVDAIRELIGKEEDSARFDMALVLSAEEIADEQFFRALETAQSTWTSEMASQLARWAWSRKAKDVFFADEDYILQCAKEIAIQFGGVIPMVKASEMRIRMAKLSAAVAALCYSTPDGQQLVVERAHVDYATRFLKMIYNKKSMRVNVSSNRADTSSGKKLIDVQGVKDMLMGYGRDVIEWLISSHSFVDQDFINAAHLVGKDANDGRTLFSNLSIKYGCLRRYKGNVLSKTPDFNEILADLRDELVEESNTEEKLIEEEEKAWAG